MTTKIIILSHTYKLEYSYKYFSRFFSLKCYQVDIKVYFLTMKAIDRWMKDKREGFLNQMTKKV